MQRQYITKIEFYDNEGAMKRGIARMQQQGWEVVSTETTNEGYSCLKTAVLGCLFLPLALLGKKPQRYKVQYRRLQ